MSKRVLITGVTGMVGSHVLDYLVKQTNWKVFGMCRWRSPLNNIHQHINEINSGKRIKLIYADLKDSISINNAIQESQPDIVFHLAAQSYPKTSFSAPLDTLDTNVQGTTRLLEAILKFDGIDPVIHVCSSSEVFGRVSPDKLPINEECTFHPASPYAISKVGTDLIGRYYAEAFGMCVMTTRMFTHTGPRRGDVFAESSFAKQIAMIEANLMPPIIKVGNLESLRTFADVRDAVEAYYLLVTHNPIAGEYYNIGGTHVCKIGEMLDFLISLSPMREQISIVQDDSRIRPIDADLQVPDTKKFFDHTGWTPKISFEVTMTDLLNYWRHEVSKNGLYINR